MHIDTFDIGGPLECEQRVNGAGGHRGVPTELSRKIRPRWIDSEQEVGPVGDDLVGVHVRLRARAGLPDDQRKIVIEFTVDDFLRRLIDGAGNVLFQLAERQIGPRCRLFLNP